MSLVSMALTTVVKARARSLGFDSVAVGPAEPPRHAEAFERWLDAGYAGSMTYLERTRADRVAPERLLPGCRSVIAAALSYNPAGRDDADDPRWRPVARYARGADYHDVMRPRLQALVAFLREVGGEGVQSRAAVDTSAVLERDLAARAGLGWIGKNTNLLSEMHGSYFFIGIVLTTAQLEPDAEAVDRCGTCTACLEACPTRAFVAPHVLDARRCISYLTIEHRGHIDEPLRAAIGQWAFGCDVCQEVCPWNRKAAPACDPALAPARPLEALEALLTLDATGFRARFRSSAISRAKRSGLLRNIALVLGNRRDTRAIPALTAATRDGDPAVRAAAEWALEAIDAQQ